MTDSVCNKLSSRVDEVGKNVIRAAKEIIIKQQTDQHETTEETGGNIKNLQQNFDLKFAKIETKIGSIEDKIDLILRNLTKY